jgi:subtilisin family serine protease
MSGAATPTRRRWWSGVDRDRAGGHGTEPARPARRTRNDERVRVRTGHKVLTLAALLAVAPVLTPVAATAAPLPSGNAQWWFAALQVGKTWAAGAQGQGVTVAVLDGGVNAGRPELAGRVRPGFDAVTGSGDGRTDVDRPRGHGTAMSIFIAGQGGPTGLVGIAPEAAIMPVRVNNGEGGSSVGDSDAVDARGIRWAVDHGAKVISMSIGAPEPCGATEQDAVSYAVEHGAVVVASAGNSGGSGAPESPGDCAGVVTTGAVDANRNPWSKTTPGPSVDVAGPGVNMASVNAAGQRGTSDGTSDSAALTSAAIALIWSKFPTLTNRQVVARLLATARDSGVPGRDAATGVGVIRPYNAITENVPATAPNPIFDELKGVTPAPGGTSPGTGGGGGTTGATSPVPPPQTPVSPTSAARESGSKLPLILIGVAVVVVLAIGIAIAAASRRRRRPVAPQWPPPGSGPPPPPWR